MLALVTELLDARRSPWLVQVDPDGIVTLSLPTSFARPGQHPLGEPTLCPWVTAHLTTDEAGDLLRTLAAGLRQVGGDPLDAIREG